MLLVIPTREIKPMFQKNTLLWSTACLLLLLGFSACNKEESGFKRYYEEAVRPNARFKITMIENCQPPYRVHFENLTTDTFGDENYLWDYGNGDTSNAISAAVGSYSEAGTYRMRLIAMNDVGIDTFDTTIVLPETQEIISDFEFSSAYGAYYWEPCPVQFTNLSQHGKTYTWEYGDGGRGFEENPLYVFDQKGTYTVTLFAECSGREESSFKTITIAGPPKVFTIEELHLQFIPADFMNDIDSADGTLGVDIFFEAFLGDVNVLNGSVIRGVDGPKQYPLVWQANDRIRIEDYNTPLLIRFYDDDFNGRPQFIGTMNISMWDLQQNFYPNEYTQYDIDDLETKLIMTWKNE